MTANTPANSFPYPTSSDDPDVPGDMAALAVAIDKRVMGVYNNASDRDTKTSTILQEGLFAYLKDTNSVTYYTGSAWEAYPPAYPAISSGTSVPSNASGSDGDIFFKV